MRLIEKGNPARRRDPRRKRVALPMLAVDVDRDQFEWDLPAPLPQAELAKCWDRVAKAVQQIADDARKLAELEERQRNREALIRDVLRFIPAGHERKEKDRARVARRIAERVVNRTMGAK